MEQEKNAFNLVNKICCDYKGSFEDHQKIQHALKLIKDCIENQEEGEGEKE